MGGYKHGYYKHPHFKRWNNICQRCLNENHKCYPNYGGRGIKIHPDWMPSNEKGVENFLIWAEEKINEFWSEHPKDIGRKIEVGRRDVNKDFSPENCFIRFFASNNHKRRSASLTEAQVIELRQIKRTMPDVTLPELEAIFHVSGATLSRALRGLIWKHVDTVEKPISRYDNGEQELPVIQPGIELATA